MSDSVLQAIAIRAYVEVAAKRKWGSRKQLAPSGNVIVFDGETTVDAAQALRCGGYGWWLDGEVVERGLFFDLEILKPSEQETLRRYASLHRLKVRTVADFVDNIFYRIGYDLQGTIVGFHLPFDISWVARHHATSRDPLPGGYSYQLSGDPERARVIVKHLSRRASLIQFAGTEGQLTPRGARKRKLVVPVQRGYFVDIKTLGSALTGRSESLASLATFLGVAEKLETDEHGRALTHQYLAYAVQDVQVTWECYAALSARYCALGLAGTQEHQIFSEASIGKAHLKEMGVRPFLGVQPNFPKELLGTFMTAYYGGRSEVRIRRQPCQVLYCDFLSMYPTVCTLMGLWPWMTAEGLTWRDSTAETQQLLDRIGLQDLQRQDTWKQLGTLVRVQPDRDCFPVRAPYGDEAQYTIGLNYLSSKKAFWYTLADCIASKLETGRAPQVLEALTFTPQGVQDHLQSICIAGNPDYRIDPTTEDFPRRLIDLRSAVKKELRNAKGKRREQLEATQMMLKLVANATSYGIFMELNVDSLDHYVNTLRYAGGPPLPIRVNKLERPGPYFHPILGTLITGAARLMLATTEALITKLGLRWAFCDTDSMAIAKPEGMGSEEFLQKAQRICEWFTRLNPYAVKGPLLKIEDANYQLDGGRITDVLEPLYCFAVSAKRYALFNVDKQGRPILRKASAHGLGHLLPPYTERQAPKSIHKPQVPLHELGVQRWQHDLWYRIVTAALAGHPDRPDFDLPNMDAPAASRYAATNPTLLKWFAGYNEGKAYKDQVRPAGFLYAYQSRDNDDGEAPRAVAPYHRDPVLAARKCFDRETGATIPMSQLKTYREVLAQYHLHPESKFLGGDFLDAGTTVRRHVIATEVEYIGKEANRWEEQFYLGNDPEQQLRYGRDVGDLEELLARITEAAGTYSQAELASVSGVSPREVGAIVRGEAQPRESTIEQLIRAISALEAEQDSRGEEQKRMLERLRAERDRGGIVALARRLGVDRSNLRKILNGARGLRGSWEGGSPGA